uniref:Uncharacterized protein n=1 Tax=Nelumbo nucifera TaxID=4432 RepID=A0A822ZN48_NELNU|nr:TPA_asm: hypothetical protein HUJ06_002596 [Nelumbo nucifera]
MQGDSSDYRGEKDWRLKRRRDAGRFERLESREEMNTREREENIHKREGAYIDFVKLNKGAILS